MNKLQSKNREGPTVLHAHRERGLCCPSPQVSLSRLGTIRSLSTHRNHSVSPRKVVNIIAFQCLGRRCRCRYRPAPPTRPQPPQTTHLFHICPETVMILPVLLSVLPLAAVLAQEDTTAQPVCSVNQLFNGQICTCAPG